MLKAINLFMQVRSDENHEDIDLDIAEHGERGYTYQDVTAGSSLSFSSVASRPDSLTTPILEASHVKSN
jgi:Amt family ammonium transporter